MNHRIVINIVSSLVAVIGIFIGSAVVVSLLCGDPPEAVRGMVISSVIPILLGGGIYYLTRGDLELGFREGFGIVTFGWIFSSLFGAIPFIIIMDMHWYDAFFETMSGFTTTGASVLDNTLVLSTGATLKSGVADLPQGLLYWRSMTHWLGGMGIVVLSLAILPFLGIGGQQLYMAEVTGADKRNRLTPRIANSAKLLWGVYFLISILQTILLCLGGMSLMDSWCHTCGTVATGGFSTMQSSVAAYDSLYIEAVITFFMFVSGANFLLHYKALRGRIDSYFRDEEFKSYLCVVLLAIITMTFFLVGDRIVTSDGKTVDGTIFNAVRYSSFQVVSIITTTGFVTADFDLWPAYCTMLLICLMFIGGCGGSTGGGMKVSRALLSLKYSLSRVHRCLFPHSVSNVRINNERIDSATLHKVISFFFIFVLLSVVFALLVAMIERTDFLTSISSSAACIGNVGPGLGKVGPMWTYSWMTPASKLILSFAMLVGRLEIYTVLVLILPSFWKR